MALIKCKECGGEVSSKAKTCPKCGASVGRRGIGCGTLVGYAVLLLIVIPMVIGLIIAAIDDSEPEPAPAPAPAKQQLTPEEAAEKEKKDKAVQLAAAGAATLKKTMRDPDSFELESALVIEESGAVCYTYRARNGFGGMNRDNAVLADGGKKFLTSDSEGFVDLWNQECGGKSGQDVSAAIRWFAL